MMPTSMGTAIQMGRQPGELSSDSGTKRFPTRQCGTWAPSGPAHGRRHPQETSLRSLHGTRLVQVPLTDVAVQVFFQGVVVSIVSLVLYGRAVVILGASGGSAFGTLVPALSALLAVPLVGEWPTRADWFGIVLISVGVHLASGGPLPILMSSSPKGSGRYFTRRAWRKIRGA